MNRSGWAASRRVPPPRVRASPAARSAAAQTVARTGCPRSGCPRCAVSAAVELHLQPSRYRTGGVEQLTGAGSPAVRRGDRALTQLEDGPSATDETAEPSAEAQIDTTQAPGRGRPDQAPSGRQLGPNQVEKGVHPGHPRRRLEDPVRRHGQGERVMPTGQHRHPRGGASRGHQICLSLRRRLRVLRGQHDDFLVGPVGHDPQQSSGRAAGHPGDAAEATGSDNSDQHVKPRLRRPDIALRAFARGEPPSRGPCWQRKGSPVPVRGRAGMILTAGSRVRRPGRAEPRCPLPPRRRSPASPCPVGFRRSAGSRCRRRPTARRSIREWTCSPTGTATASRRTAAHPPLRRQRVRSRRIGRTRPEVSSVL